MRSILRIVGYALLIALAGGGYWLYQLVWGRPFNFDHLIDRQSIYFLMEQPELLTQLGAIDGTMLDYHSDKLDEFTLAERDRFYAVAKRNIDEIKSYDRASLTAEQQTTYDVMLWWQERALLNQRFPWATVGGLYPMNQMFGEQLGLPRFMQFSHQVKNEKTARNYVVRLNAFGTHFDQVLVEIERQASLKVLPPRFVIDAIIASTDTFRKPDPKDNPLVATFREKLGKLTDIDKKLATELEAAAVAAVKDVVYPAYGRIKATFERLRPQATEDDGVWKLPGGDAFYADAVRQFTTTDMTPEQIHTLGLAEVVRLEGEMDAVLRSVGETNGPLVDRMERLSRDPRFTFSADDAGRERILAGYRTLLEAMQKRLPEAFKKIPPQKLEVVRVPTYAEATSAGAYYNPPSFDGGKPGQFFANVRDPAETASWQMPTLAYHEGVPGHHFQIATAQNIEGVAFARRVLPFTAFSEGWALYAEHLAKDMGVYDKDPYGDLGRLQAEMFRAVRLVADTGIHAKRWTRQQAIDYMHSKTGMSVTEVTSEIERYIVMPGQALAYKIGMLKILELRERAKAALAAKFDLKAFHEIVLGGGALPLTILEQRVDTWIALQKKAA
ncbi:MAG: DUF885 domain-containing protein [Alphaproteobacteria bacterium]|nr:DUF885 domain-containing protein [Alphaproteobacteria bacterium]